MKATKPLSLLVISILILWSCEEDDSGVVQSIEPSFTITQSTENSGIYFFENTTPGKDNLFSFWQFELEGPKVADENGVVEHEFLESGPKRVTLSLVGNKSTITMSEDLQVTVEPPADTRFIINPENLLSNPYFAEGSEDDFTGWHKNNGSDRMTQETMDVRIGFRALHVVNTAEGNPWDAQLVSDAAPTVNGDAYTISMWIKGSGQVRFSTNPGVGGDQYGADYVVTADWQQYAWTFNANSDNTLIAMDMGAKAGDFIIDGVELVKGSSPLELPSNDSEIINGDFEEGGDDDFPNWNKNNGADRVTQETEDVISGSRALKVTNGADGNPWDTQLVSEGFTTTNGDSYIVSMWIKGSGQVRFSTNPGVGGDQYGADFVASADWTQYTWSFTANSETTLLALDMGAKAGEFVIDKVKVTKD